MSNNSNNKLQLNICKIRRIAKLTPALGLVAVVVCIALYTLARRSLCWQTMGHCMWTAEAALRHGYVTRSCDVELVEWRLPRT